MHYHSDQVNNLNKDLQRSLKILMRILKYLNKDIWGIWQEELRFLMGILAKIFTKILKKII